MGNSLAASEPEEAGQDEVVTHVPDPTAKPGWFGGAPPNLTVDVLLRSTKRNINYDPNPPKATVEKIPVPHGYIFPNLLTPDECRQYIEMGEEMGFEPSPLRDLGTTNSNSFSRDSHTTTIRNSERVLFDVPDQIGDVLNLRLLPLLPDELDIDGHIWCKQVMNGGLAGCPLNKRWRLGKYHADQFFKPHFDAGYVYSKNEMTVLTFILYLNEGFVGGETKFFPEGKKQFHSQPIPGLEWTCVPEIGKGIVFLQTGLENPRHEGCPHTTQGQFKYILRSDVSYFRKVPRD